MKSIQITKRSAVLIAILMASVGAAVHVSRDASGVIQPVSRSSTASQERLERTKERVLDPVLAEGEDRVDMLTPRRIDDDLYPLFPTVAKAVEPSAAAGIVEELPPAVPTAPPLPFKFMGQMLDNGTVTVFLVFNERNIVVKAGDTIDGIYHVDAIQSGVVEFTYLPLKQKQTLPVGERS